MKVYELFLSSNFFSLFYWILCAASFPISRFFSLLFFSFDCNETYRPFSDFFGQGTIYVPISFLFSCFFGHSSELRYLYSGVLLKTITATGQGQVVL